MKIYVIVAAVALLCAGCQSIPKDRQAQFVESEYAPYSQPGTGAIKGQAFMVTRGGMVVKAAGRKVWLNPVTSYSTEWWKENVLGNQALKPGDPRAAAYSRFAVADGDGNFEFTSLPAGSYYLACPMSWEVPGGAETGGTARAEVSVRNGETAKAVVTR